MIYRATIHQPTFRCLTLRATRVAASFAGVTKAV